jgi:hypothetical protein
VLLDLKIFNMTCMDHALCPFLAISTCMNLSGDLFDVRTCTIVITMVRIYSYYFLVMGNLAILN